jgi:crotonobetainyl-CoA:carnitine CoA-transferase CaiB-like acyl-CoA transferase
MWHRGRKLVALDLEDDDDRETLQKLVDAADVVIDDLPSAGWRPTPPESAIVVRLPLHDGSDTVGFSEIAATAAGLYSQPLRRGPQFTPMAIAAWLTTLYAAIGICAALIARERDGRGQRVTVPQSDAVLSLMDLYALFTFRSPTRWSPIRWAASPFMRAWKCADDRYIYIHAGMPHHAAKLLEVLELEELVSPETLRDPTVIQSVSEARAITRAFKQCFLDKAARKWEALLSEEGLCAIKVRPLKAWMKDEPAEDAEHIVELDDEEEDEVRQPGLNVFLEDTPGEPQPRPEDETEADELLEAWEEASPWLVDPSDPVDKPPLADLVVLDATQVIAGPAAARTLAELGARVVRIENPKLTAAWVEPFHIAYNPGKESIAIDLSSEAGPERLEALLSALEPDVVIDNFRQGVGERLGLRSPKEDSIHASITAYGPEGEWEGYPGWEQTVQAATGMQADWGGSGPPKLYPQPVNDFATGLSGALAVMLGLVNRARTGDGQSVSTSLAATALHLQSPCAWRPGMSRATGANHPGVDPLRRFYKSSSGWFFFAAAPDALEDLEGLEDFDEDEGPAAYLEAAFSQHPLTTWQSRFSGRLADLTPLKTTRAALQAARKQNRGIFIQEKIPGIGTITRTGPALQLSATPLVHLGPAAPRGLGTIEDIKPDDLLPIPYSRSNRLSWMLEQARWGVFLATNL